MLSQNEMQEKLKKEFDSIEKQEDFVTKKLLDLWVNSVNQGRDLIKDTVLISTTVVGFVIPLLLTSNIRLDKNLLLVSAVCFIATIVYGILLRLFVLKKELENYPKILDETLSKLNKDKLTITSALNKNNLDDKTFREAFTEIAERHKPEKEKERWWNKIINHDTGFYGLFIVALILVMISIFKDNFLIYDIFNYFKK